MQVLRGGEEIIHLTLGQEPEVVVSHGCRPQALICCSHHWIHLRSRYNVEGDPVLLQRDRAMSILPPVHRVALRLGG